LIVFIDASGIEAQLGGSDGRDVAGRTAAENYQFVSNGFHESALEVGVTQEF
jgi:hypothetical protein